MCIRDRFIKGNLIADITDVLSMTVPGESKKVSEKIAGGFTDNSLTNPYGDGKTYLAPMFYSPCGLFYNAGFLTEKGWDVPPTWDEMWELGDQAAAAQAYLLGSVDTGILVSKYLYHDDVRNHGSGAAGMTNMLRCV